MDEQNQLTPKEEQNQPQALTNSELDEVVGGLSFACDDGVAIVSPRDPASGLPTGRR